MRILKTKCSPFSTNHCLFLLISCPEEEEEYTSESEEEKRAAEARVQKIYKLQGIWKILRSRICYFSTVVLNIYYPWVNHLGLCIRESDEPGPADLLEPGGEAAHLHRALCTEWAEGCFAGWTASHRSARLRGAAPGCRSAGCSSARGWDVAQKLIRNKKFSVQLQ